MSPRLVVFFGNIVYMRFKTEGKIAGANRQGLIEFCCWLFIYRADPLWRKVGVGLATGWEAAPHSVKPLLRTFSKRALVIQLS